jgi:hypothetical protein
MAVNFGDTIMEGGIAPSVAVQAPVQDNSGAILAESLGGVAKTVGAIAGSIFQQNEASAADKINTDFQNALSYLADDVAQGAMDNTEAMTRARVILREYSANNPSLREDFNKTWASVMAENGLAHVVIEGTVEQQALEEKKTAAIKAGYTSMEAYDSFLQQTQQHDLLLRQAAAASASNTVMSENLRQGLLTSATGIADKAYNAAENQMRATMAAIEANPAQAAEIAAQFTTQMSVDINMLKSKVGVEGADYIIAPITGLLETFNAWSTGSVETAVLEGRMKNVQQQYAAMYYNDPEVAAIIAQQAMFNSVGLPPEFGIQNWTPEALQKIKEVKRLGSVNILDNTEGSARYVDNLQEIAASVTASTDPALITDLMESVNASIEGAWVNERSADGALGFKDLVTLLGSPEIANLVDIGGGITAAHADQLPAILESNYANELVPAVQKYWESVPIQNPTNPETNGAGGSTGLQNIPMNQLLQPVWNGSAVEFIPAEAYKDNPRIIALAGEVNTGASSIGIPLNSLINAQALVTKTDPKTVWEQNFAGRLFNLGAEGTEGPLAEQATTPAQGSEEPASEAPNESEDTFTIGDFAPDTLEPVAEYVSQNSAIQAQLPPIDVAYTDVEGVDYDSYLPSIRASESGGNDSAKNPTSTATGRYQFLKSTWTGLVDKYPNSGLTYEGRLDPNQQEIAIRIFTAENARYLKNNGVPLSNGTLYGAHFLGASDAAKVLKASDSDLISAHVPARVIEANNFLRGKTVAWFKDWVNRKGNA